jgi:hypothetical protein
MRHQRNAQRLELSDPTVARFAQECGLAKNAVSIRLVGVSEEDVKIQIARLERAFGALIMMTQARQSGKGMEWIAYGTLVG